MLKVTKQDRAAVYDLLEPSMKVVGSGKQVLVGDTLYNLLGQYCDERGYTHNEFQLIDTTTVGESNHV